MTADYGVNCKQPSRSTYVACLIFDSIRASLELPAFAIHYVDLDSCCGENAQALEQDFIRFDKDGDRCVDYKEITICVPASRPGDAYAQIRRRVHTSGACMRPCSWHLRGRMPRHARACDLMGDSVHGSMLTCWLACCRI
jgi:hypothetical protein